MGLGSPLTMLKSAPGKVLEEFTTDSPSSDHKNGSLFDLIHQTSFHFFFGQIVLKGSKNTISPMHTLRFLLLLLLYLNRIFATAATKGALKILYPAPSSLHYITPMNPPLIDLLINVDIDLEDFQSFAQARGRDFAGVFVIVELDKLDSTVDGVYEEVGRVEVKEVREKLGGR